VAICSVENKYHGLFRPGKGQYKYLLVAMDYFTKWIETETLASIMGNKVQAFVWKSIICAKKRSTQNLTMKA